MADLEFGVVKLSAKMQRLVKTYRKHKEKIHQLGVAFLALTIALVIKAGYHNIDKVVESATAITLDEPSYVPFKLSDTVFTTVKTRSSIKFPIKESHVNTKMQSLNLIQARDRAREYLDEGSYTCIHLRHFDVPYDIIVFDNVTMVNPQVTRESDDFVYVKETSLDGESQRVQRPTFLDITYVDEGLVTRKTTLVGNQAVCFAHYEF